MDAIEEPRDLKERDVNTHARSAKRVFLADVSDLESHIEDAASCAKRIRMFWMAGAKSKLLDELGSLRLRLDDCEAAGALLESFLEVEASNGPRR